MLNANHRSKSSTASRALAGLTFVALIALAGAMALFSRGLAPVAEARNAQDQNQQFVATAPMRKGEAERNNSPVEQRQKASDQTLPMNRSMRPKILYREKAQYTQEARNNGIQGVVVLMVGFGADAQIRDIELVRGLPDGLSEKAIEAAKKIRFEPAMRDGQPVSVRGKLEYSFNLRTKSQRKGERRKK